MDSQKLLLKVASVITEDTMMVKEMLICDGVTYFGDDDFGLGFDVQVEDGATYHFAFEELREAHAYLNR